ncbi:MAG: ubiquitin carboxyl-terminal hydrolase [Holosporaceae bacterium]|nr:ubiquitin carboxyl-terminal hydrolase [Holosporaceae bacterium]
MFRNKIPEVMNTTNIVQGENYYITIPDDKKVFSIAKEAADVASEIYKLTQEKKETLEEFFDAFIREHQKITAEELGFMAAYVKEANFEKHRIGQDGEAVSINEQAIAPGLRNLTATCYMNASLQSLFALETFRNAILNAPDHPVHKALKGLFQKMSRSLVAIGSEVMSPLFDIVKEEVEKNTRHLDKKGNVLKYGFTLNKEKQEDAGEFIEYLLNALRDNENKNDFIGYFNIGRTIEKQCNSEHHHTWSNSSDSNNIIANVPLENSSIELSSRDFTQKLLAAVKGGRPESVESLCDECLKANELEGSDIGSLCSACKDSNSVCKTGVTITSYDKKRLERLCNEVGLESKCTSCQNRVKACTNCQKRKNINKTGVTSTPRNTGLPLVLIVQLLRFDGKKKIITPVDFSGAETLTIPYGDNNRQQKTYKLRAIIAHDGSREDGHYWAYVRGNGDAWYCQNDSNSDWVGNLATVVNHKGCGSMSTAKRSAYIFFYEQVNN